MIKIKFLKSKLTGNIYPQQVDLRPFNAKYLADKPEAKDFDEVRTQDVKIKGVRFNAAQRVKREVAQQSIHLEKDPGRRVSTATTRWRVFLAQMLKNCDNLNKPVSQIPVTISLYRMHTGTTDYTARKDLTSLCAKGLLTDISTAHTKMYLIV